jgi:TusA-related sulfurtransferase
MTKDEALDLALEALEYIENNYMSLPKSGSEAITAIKQARSAPVQEPVAFNAGVPPLYPEMKDGETISVEYTNPPAAQKDIQRLSALVRAQQITIDKLEQARSAPVQEPVAIVDEDGVIVVCNYKYKPGDKLYTTPPAAQRQWVGLTDEQMVDAIEPLYQNRATAEMAAKVSIDEFRAIEAKLRSKNNG